MNPTCKRCGATMIRDKDGFWMCSDLCFLKNHEDEG